MPFFTCSQQSISTHYSVNTEKLKSVLRLFRIINTFYLPNSFFPALSRAIMVLAPSESCILSSDNGLSFPSVSFHSACMLRVAVGPLILYWKRIWNRLYVALFKYSLWPGNLFSLWYFSQLFWARPWFFYLDLPTPNFWRQTFSFLGTCSTCLPDFLKKKSGCTGSSLLYSAHPNHTSMSILCKE